MGYQAKARGRCLSSVTHVRYEEAFLPFLKEMELSNRGGRNLPTFTEYLQSTVKGPGPRPPQPIFFCWLELSSMFKK